MALLDGTQAAPATLRFAGGAAARGGSGGERKGARAFGGRASAASGGGAGAAGGSADQAPGRRAAADADREVWREQREAQQPATDVAGDGAERLRRRGGGRGGEDERGRRA